MTKRLILTIAALLASVALLAQSGGVSGTVVNRDGRQPVENAVLVLSQGAQEIATAKSADDGTFRIRGLADGNYTLIVKAPDFLEAQIQFAVVDGQVKNLFNVGLTGIQKVSDLDEDSFAAFDMNDSGFNDNPTILFGSNDVQLLLRAFPRPRLQLRESGSLPCRRKAKRCHHRLRSVLPLERPE